MSSDSGFSSSDARGYERFPVRVRLHLTVLLPEETFTPITADGLLTEVSAVGLRVKTPLLRQEQAEAIHRGPVWVKLEIAQPGEPDYLVFRAKPFWARYYPESRTERGYTELGFSLRGVDPEHKEYFVHLVERYTPAG